MFGETYDVESFLIIPEYKFFLVFLSMYCGEIFPQYKSIIFLTHEKHIKDQHKSSLTNGFVSVLGSPMESANQAEYADKLCLSKSRRALPYQLVHFWR